MSRGNWPSSTQVRSADDLDVIQRRLPVLTGEADGVLDRSALKRLRRLVRLYLRRVDRLHVPVAPPLQGALEDLTAEIEAILDQIEVRLAMPFRLQ